MVRRKGSRRGRLSKVYPRGRYRNFKGDTYRWVGPALTKEEAEKKAMKWRKDGHNARITTHKYGYNVWAKMLIVREKI